MKNCCCGCAEKFTPAGSRQNICVAVAVAAVGANSGRLSCPQHAHKSDGGGGSTGQYSGGQAAPPGPAAPQPYTLTDVVVGVAPGAGYQELWSTPTVVDVDTIADFVMVHCAGAIVLLLLQEQEKQGVPPAAAAPWPL